MTFQTITEAQIPQAHLVVRSNPLGNVTNENLLSGRRIVFDDPQAALDADNALDRLAMDEEQRRQLVEHLTSIALNEKPNREIQEIARMRGPVILL